MNWTNLTLGAGSKLKGDGWLNHDRLPRPGIDISFDMGQFPWPVEHLRGKVEHILAEDCLEHIPKHLIVKVMDECWMLLTPDGDMEIQIPIHGSFNHLADLSHCWAGSLNTFDLLDPDTVVGSKNPWYTGKRWRIFAKKQDAPSEGFNCHFLMGKRP